MDEGEIKCEGACNGFQYSLACLCQSGWKPWLQMGVLTGITSRPIPSPGINPIRSDLEAIGECVEFITCLEYCRSKNSSAKL